MEKNIAPLGGAPNFDVFGSAHHLNDKHSNQKRSFEIKITDTNSSPYHEDFTVV